MKAVIITQFGPAEELHLAEMDKPIANDDQVVIKVMAAGINPVDTKIRSGNHISSKNLHLPAILGKDVSGIIDSVGKNITYFKPGESVFGCNNAGKTYAEFTLADPDSVVKKPKEMSFEEAAAAPLASLTAYQAINDHLKLKPNQKVLIQAAAGGVGHLAVQFAKINGAYVYGTASAKNTEFLKQLGIDEVIDYKNERFEDKVPPLDAVLDAIGGDVLYRSIACVKPGGTIVCLPSSTKDDPKALALAIKHRVKLIWPMMYLNRDQLQLIADLLEHHKLKVEIDSVFPLEDIIQAHKAIESHDTKGKIVVRI
ncbi:NADP-dependent oxidoreductase [Arcticibacter eurypsychrophilus]|uniref:NADP-dependent oxidoreductase n=1 Tax=Arcticibacter eurypsychrophilus TaxID=1434752 RepID=UPI00084DF071|nr:NADP-dependent oxidoreductase [Arcticibacter eurypsychrophilus]